MAGAEHAKPVAPPAAPQPFDLHEETWWQVFRDRELDRLETLALQANEDLRRAVTRITQSRLQARIVAADFFPHFDARIDGARIVNSDNSTVIRDSPYKGGPGEIMTIQTRSSTQNAWDGILQLNWEVDVFGRIRAAYASSRAQAQATMADARGVRLSITADLATGYFALRTADTEVAVLEQTAGFRRESLWLNEARTNAGVGGPEEVARARLELNNVEADLAEARRQRHALEKNLALLCGQPSPDFHVPVLSLRARAPVLPRVVPAVLLTRRPDVAASERRLAATLQDIRQARAEMLPKVTVGGYVGQMSEDIEHFADRKSHEATIMPVITLPVFEGGRNEANVQLARARRDEAAADYKESVLTAFREADTALDDLRQRQVQANAQEQAVQDARAVLSFSQDRFAKGTASYFQVVTDQTTLLSAELNAARILNSRYAAAVDFARAIGGGWPEDAPSPPGTFRAR